MRPFVHNKTGNIYYAIEQVTNATNAQDGQDMVLYRRDGNLYVREVTEFHEKFTELTLKVGDLVAIGDGVYPITEIKGDEVFVDTPYGPKCYQTYQLLHPWRVIKPGAMVVVMDGSEVVLTHKNLESKLITGANAHIGIMHMPLGAIQYVTAYPL